MSPFVHEKHITITSSSSVTTVEHVMAVFPTSPFQVESLFEAHLSASRPIALSVASIFAHKTSLVKDFSENDTIDFVVGHFLPTSCANIENEN